MNTYLGMFSIPTISWLAFDKIYFYSSLENSIHSHKISTKKGFNLKTGMGASMMVSGIVYRKYVSITGGKEP